MRSVLLEDRVAIVTGGARGIGRACVAKFIEHGAAGVVIADADRRRGEETAHDLSTGDGRVLLVPTDVTVRDDVERCVARTLAELGRLDIIVNNAGIAGKPGSLASAGEEELDRIFAVNVKGPWFFCAAAHRHFLERRYGRVVNIASIAGKEGNPGLVPYSMTKAALIGMTKAYAREVAQDGVLVNSVAPAVIETEILEQVTPQVREYMISKIPMGRTGRPEEVAELVAFLASDRLSFSTGFCYDISGGRATY